MQHVNDEVQLEKNGPNVSTAPVSNYPKSMMLREMLDVCQE